MTIPPTEQPATPIQGQRMRPRSIAIPPAVLLAGACAVAQSDAFNPQANTPPTSPSWPSLLLWGGGVLLALWAASRLRLALKTRLDARGSSAGAGSPNPEDLRALARDLEELADRLAERLDAKAERLEQLLRRADEQTAALAEPPSPTYSSLAPRASRDPGAKPPRLVAECTTDPATSRIYALADSGVSARDISQQLDEPIGKVQLILALRG